MRKGKSLHGRFGSQARLPIQGDNQVSRAETDAVPDEKLVKSDGIQRPQDGREAPDAGLRRKGERNGLASIQVGGGRRRNPD